MAYKRMMDLHVHTDNSFDGHHSAMFLCEQAVHKGLRAIAFTDHMDIDSYIPQQLNTRQVQAYFEISKARTAFQGKLLVLSGIELGQGIFDMALSEKTVYRFDYDFIIGSMHERRDFTDYSQLKYDEYTTDEIYDLLEKYAQDLYQLALWGHFDTMAHITYPLRYICGNYEIPINFSRFDDIMDEVFKTLIVKGKALEINTSGLRQKLRETMPGERYVKRFRELGGEYITIGSDAHYACDIGSGIQHGLELAQKCGFRYATFFQKREPMPVPIEK